MKKQHLTGIKPKLMTHAEIRIVQAMVETALVVAKREPGVLDSFEAFELALRPLKIVSITPRTFQRCLRAAFVDANRKVKIQ